MCYNAYMARVAPERKNDFAVAPHAMSIMPSNPNETKSVSPHAVNVMPPERQVQEDDGNR